MQLCRPIVSRPSVGTIGSTFNLCGQPAVQINFTPIHHTNPIPFSLTLKPAEGFGVDSSSSPSILKPIGLYVREPIKLSYRN